MSYKFTGYVPSIKEESTKFSSFNDLKKRLVTAWAENKYWESEEQKEYFFFSCGFNRAKAEEQKRLFNKIMEQLNE